MAEAAARILEGSFGKVVLIKLRGGRSLRGKLRGFDQHLNLVLEEAEDISREEDVQRIGEIIVRGDNVVIISPPPR
jgi:small nuclear ribonucleoprotein